MLCIACELCNGKDGKINSDAKLTGFSGICFIFNGVTSGKSVQNTVYGIGCSARRCGAVFTPVADTFVLLNDFMGLRSAILSTSHNAWWNTI